MVLTESTPGVDVEYPVLETGEERERFWEEVSSKLAFNKYSL
jgi:hypothetical protein